MFYKNIYTVLSALILFAATLAACGSGDVTVQANGTGNNGARLLSLSVTPTNPTIAKDTIQNFTATGVYSDNTTKDLSASVIWSVSDTNIAAIDTLSVAGSSSEFSPSTNKSGGHAYGKGTGSTTITAITGDVSGSTTITVTSATLVSLAITPTNPSIARGTSQQFIATGTFSDNTTQDLTTQVTWNSSNTGAATISASGFAVSTAVGSTTISGASGSISGSTTLTVNPATLVSLAITPANPTIAKGTSQQFTATGTYSDNTTQDLTTSVTWNSSNTAIATISNAAGSKGSAASVAAGSTTVTATSGSISGSTSLTVTAATLMSIAIAPVNPSITQGTTQQFIATGTYSDGSTQNLTTAVTWSPANTGIATISNAAGSKGLATGVAAGTTTITAVSGSVSGTATLTVTTASTGSPTLTWTAPTSYSDGTPVAAGDITGYRVYYSNKPGSYSSGSYHAVAASITSLRLADLNLTPGLYYFVVTALDLTGTESTISNEVSANL